MLKLGKVVLLFAVIGSSIATHDSMNPLGEMFQNKEMQPVPEPRTFLTYVSQRQHDHNSVQETYKPQRIPTKSFQRAEANLKTLFGSNRHGEVHNVFLEELANAIARRNSVSLSDEVSACSADASHVMTGIYGKCCHLARTERVS